MDALLKVVKLLKKHKFLLLYAGVGFASFYLLIEQISLQRKRGKLPGPRWTIPFIGAMGEIILSPHNFYTTQSKYGGLSWNSALGMSLLFARDSAITREVLSDPERFKIWVTSYAPLILGKDNIIFMQGEPHKMLRRRLLPLFTPRALSIFLQVQDKVIKKHLNQWYEESHKNADGEGKPFMCRSLVRVMNVETSAQVFVGTYVDDQATQKIADLFWEINAGFVSVPINLPGTTIYKAYKAREKIMEIFIDCVVKSRERMKKGQEPGCLVDLWMEEEARVGRKLETDEELAQHVMDFLFASQDASSSSVVWAIALLAKHPEILEKVRAEQIRVRPPGTNERVDVDLIGKMTYTKQFVKEVLRYRPPATMVPHIVLKDTYIQGHHVPKGTIVLPSFWDAHIDDFEKSDTFDPGRFQESKEDSKLMKSFLAFGYGTHRCIGNQYALNHLMLFTSELVRHWEFKRQTTLGGDEIVYLPTIFPADGCIITLNKRM